MVIIIIIISSSSSSSIIILFIHLFIYLFICLFVWFCVCVCLFVCLFVVLQWISLTSSSGLKRCVAFGPRTVVLLLYRRTTYEALGAILCIFRVILQSSVCLHHSNTKRMFEY